MKRAVLAALLGFAIPLEAHAEEGWTFSLTPYLWLPNINGSLKYAIPPGGGARPEVDTGPNNYLENLSFALMLAGEARKGKWSAFTDLIYLDFDKEGSTVKAVNFGGDRISTSLNTSTKSSLTGVAWTFGAGYSVVQDPRHSLDLLGGARYFGLKASSDWQLSAAVNGPNNGQVFRIGYKFTWGTRGALWGGSEEWPGNSRILEVVDVNGDGFVYRHESFGDEATNKDNANLNPAAHGTIGWTTDLHGCGPEARENSYDFPSCSCTTIETPKGRRISVPSP